MTHAISRLCTLTAMAFALLSASCGMADTEATAAAARAKAQENWKLTIENAEPLALERLDIYLVEDDGDAEVFKLYGDDVTLVGEFPLSLHVGYEEDFSRLVGKTIALDAEGGDPSDPESAFVTLWGTVELQVEGDEGARTLRGKFAVHAVTWG